MNLWLRTAFYILNLYGMNIETLYLQSAIKKFNDYKQLADKTFEQLSEADFLYQPNSTTNSIAIIIQHMHGNMLSRWTNFLTEDGEKEWRQRDAEFDVQPLSKEQLLDLWNKGWQVLLDTLNALQPDDLMKTITIRQQPIIVVDAINRQLTHYSYHVGQIVLLGKWIRAHEWKSLSIEKGQSKQYNEQKALNK